LSPFARALRISRSWSRGVELRELRVHQRVPGELRVHKTKKGEKGEQQRGTPSDKGVVLKKQKGRENTEMVARSLLCFWGAGELGLSLTELACQLGMTVAGMGYAVRKGKKIARENHYRLLKAVS